MGDKEKCRIRVEFGCQKRERLEECSREECRHGRIGWAVWVAQKAAKHHVLGLVHAVDSETQNAGADLQARRIVSDRQRVQGHRQADLPGEPPRDLTDRVIRAALRHPNNLWAFLHQTVPVAPAADIAGLSL
jgi:hypothetical protein